MDTGSFIVQIKTVSIFNDHYQKERTRKLFGVMKDKLGGKFIAALREKTIIKNP